MSQVERPKAAKKRSGRCGQGYLHDSTNCWLRNAALHSSIELYGVRSAYYQDILDHAACAFSRAYGSSQIRILDILPEGGDYLVGLGQRLEHLSLAAFEPPAGVEADTLLKLRRFDMEGRVNFLLMDKASEHWQIPANDETFDGITCFNRLNLVTDPRQLLPEICRVLKTAGLLVLTNVNRLSLGGLYYSRQSLGPRQLSPRTQQATGTIRPISSLVMLDMLRRNGLRVLYFGGLGSPRALYYRLLVRIISQFGNTEKRLRYEYRQISRWWEPSSFWSHFANVNFIIATKVRQDG